MAERKFTRALTKPGTAAQLRETVSQVLRETAVQNAPQRIEPLDYEAHLAKNRTLFHNDSHRELVIFPAEDIIQTSVPRECRTTFSTVPSHVLEDSSNYFARKCSEFYTADWKVVTYKYSQYSGSYTTLPGGGWGKRPPVLPDQKHETDFEDLEDDTNALLDPQFTHEGYLLKGPEGANDKMFANIATKSFKRRFCRLKQDPTGSYFLDVCKEEKKPDMSLSICLDECVEILRNVRRNKFGFQLRLTNQRSYIFAASSEEELTAWLSKLAQCVHYTKMQAEDKKLAEKEAEPPPANSYGTLRSLESSLNPQLTKYARETEISIAQARKENRFPVFSLYPNLSVMQDSYETILHSCKVEPYREKFGQRILVKCESISFRLQAPIEGESGALGQVEPFFTTVALYDAKLNKKISEDFHFDVNQSHVQSMRSGSGDDHSNTEIPGQWLSSPRQAVFSVRNTHNDIFLVVRVETILQGSIHNVTDPYVKPYGDSKTAARVQKSARAYAAKLGKYRMPFAWTARPLFRGSGELDTTGEFVGIFRQDGTKISDEDLYKTLGDFRKPEKLSRLTTIPGSLKIRVENFEGTLPNMLTSSLIPIKPFPAPPTHAPTFERAEFPSNHVEEAYPHTTYVNQLYVYPRNLKYDSQKTFHRARNLACVVELRDSDSREAKPLKVLFGRPGQSRFVSQWICPVAHHVTTPSWYDEVKINLPSALNSKHHLLFTFLHVSCELSKQKKDSKDGSPDAVVGYAWLPLLHKGRLRVEPVSLPVAAHLPPGYLSFEPLGLGKGYAGPEIRWVDSQKPLFNVNLELVSTVTARDQHLHNFFMHMAKLNESRSLASLLPVIAEPDTTKPIEETAQNASAAQDGSRELSKLVKASDLVSKTLKALHAVDAAAIVHHLPVILNQLLWLLIRVNSEEVSVNVLKVIIHIVHQVHEINKGDLLDAYVEFVFVTPPSTESPQKFTVHEEMVKAISVLLRHDNTDFLVVHKFLSHAAFFLRIIAKSMAQFLLDTGRIKMQRQERFHADFASNIQSLVKLISPHIQHKYKDLPVETRHANLAVAEFIKKCLSLMDRGFAFGLINCYLNTFRPDDPRVLYEYKFQFLQWICFHEHYVALNLPLTPNWNVIKTHKDAEQEFRLCETFCKNHFLAGLILQEVRTALCEVVDVRKVALRSLRDLLAKHELDDRYQQKVHQSRIVTLYLPWIFVVLDNWNRLTVTNPVDAATSAVASTASGIATPILKPGQSRSLPRNVLPLQSPVSSKGWQRSTVSFDSQSTSSTVRFDFNSNRNSSYLAIIAGQATPLASQSVIFNGSSAGSLGNSDESSTVSFDTSTIGGSQDLEGSTKEKSDKDKEKVNGKKDKTHSRNPSMSAATTIIRYDKLQVEEVKDVLVCFLYVMKYASDDAIVCWWNNASQHDLLCFFHITELCLHHFKYVGKRRMAARDLSGTGGRASTLPPRTAPPSFASRTRSVYETNNTSSSDGDSIHRALLESNMSVEVGLMVLDIVGLYCIHFKDALLLYEGDNPVMRKILDIYLSFLQIGLSETLSKHVFAALRAFINNFSIALFQGNAGLCGRLCYEVLRCCASKLHSVRQEACAVLYLLMRSNFEFSQQKALTRVHLQVIISVSRLLGEIGGLNGTRFAESLNVINGFAKSDKAMQNTNFPNEVRDLTKRTQTVLKATIQMRQQAQDPELLIDLQHSLANSYSATPELRKTWLDTMARHHARFGNWTEAALCQIHVAALIAEYLHRSGLRLEGCRAFASLSPNIVCDETNLRLDSGYRDSQYDEDALIEQLEESSRAVEKAERYEMLIDLYRVLLPFYERRRDYAGMSEAYNTLSQACARAAEVTRTGRRLLGTYYRVAFYGKAKFGEEAGIEYVYKEPKVTQLPEISERLQKLYSSKFGAENVKLVMDSNDVNVSELDANMAYIQVTHVVPYFEEDELCERVTDYERNHNINRFMYEVPFTLDGKARGCPEDQCKRRVILKTQYSFPYVKKRLRVTQKSSIDLSPIEVALDEMAQKVKELAEVIRNQPTDIKKLQLRLQGSISVQVNAGPLAYASAFLVRECNKYPEEQVQQLRELFKDFVNMCGAALELNGKLISSDQRDYQEALRSSYRELVASLSNLLEDPSFAADWDGSINSSLLLKRSSVLFFNFIGGSSTA